MEFMPQHAPLVVLAFLGTGFTLLVAAAILAHALATRRYGRAKLLFLATLVGPALYLGVLLGVSLASEEKVLGPGEWKYLCEIDCHTAYSLADVRTTKTLGPVAAAGTFYVVTVKTWFDERTISSHRGNAPLTPNPRRVFVLDEAGNRHERVEAAERALQQAGIRSVPLTQPVRPGESYLTVLVFDLPASARDPRLLITNEPSESWFLIGHENSPLHKKIEFRLAPSA